MTARERLREAADVFEQLARFQNDIAAQRSLDGRAAALRVIASRLEEEMARVVDDEQNARDVDSAGEWATAAREAELLARLDADIPSSPATPPPTPGGTMKGR